eukprot:TRINITY_DN4507_c0_g2_i3.p1 TRINITY_DN4507_c0_g2~~TRINITY_DN4507_c0_g2_i3.p1  ORF type:complete len:167 (+),score=14.08 TRINITY_DN4507_c0_g2_i3:121-621(+)
MSQHVCADLRVKLFNATVLPVLLYGLSSLTLKPMHLSLLRGTRLKMLRNMAGWRRLDAESWHDTMHRMRQRVDRLLASTSCPEISSMLASSRWRLAKRLLTGGYDKWAPHLLNLPSIHGRARGRPPAQWTDDLQKFCRLAGEPSLQTALSKPELEEQYVRYCSRDF